MHNALDAQTLDQINISASLTPVLLDWFSWALHCVGLFLAPVVVNWNSPRTGKILLVGGRVMATKGNVATPGYEIDALDGPVLQQKVVIHLLG
ncbi:MAG: hypothetical protein ACYC9L_15845, partial [Sulfuricaulis sp.]